MSVREERGGGEGGGGGGGGGAGAFDVILISEEFEDCF